MGVVKENMGFVTALEGDTLIRVDMLNVGLELMSVSSTTNDQTCLVLTSNDRGGRYTYSIWASTV